MMKGSMRILMLAAAAIAAVAQVPNHGADGHGGQGNQGGSQSGQGNPGHGDQKQASDFDKYTSGGLVDVIVQFTKTATWNDVVQVRRFQDQSDQDDEQNENRHGQNKHNLNIINGLHLKVPSWAVPLISAMPGVLYVSPVRPVSKTLDIVDATVYANIAWNYGWDGTGVGVAIIDSGIYQHDDLKNAAGTGSRVVYSQSFVTGTDGSDQFGHGTHVAGIVGANGKDSSGPGFTRTFKGVAPNVNLINFRVLDANGAGQESNVIAAIQTAIQLKTAYNIRVINLSLGRPVYESYRLDPLCQAVEAAWRAGIVVVAAAGNSGRDNSWGSHGYGTILAPGNDPYIITVGATKTMGTPWRWDDSIASYSSKGPTLVDHIVKPDLVAPGNAVVSTLAPGSTLATLYPGTLISNSYYASDLETTSYLKSSNYFRLSGTSMATPVVSGAAALLIQQNPSITPDQVKARLMKTAGKMLPMFSTGIDSWTFQVFNNQSDIFTVGAGYLDVNAALTSTELVDLPAMSPTAFIDLNTGRVKITRGLNVWGSSTDSVVWGDCLVWGTSVIAATDTSGLSVVWGDTVFGAVDSVVWGDSLLTATPPQPLDSGDSDQ